MVSTTRDSGYRRFLEKYSYHKSLNLIGFNNRWLEINLLFFQANPQIHTDPPENNVNKLYISL